MAVERVEITSRAPYDGFESYERVRGVLHYAVDPSDERNARVTDIGIAQRGDDGLVRFESDFVLLAPASGSATRMLHMVSNRGRIGMVPFSMATRPVPLELTDAIEPGDAFLLRHGWAVLWCGWQHDVQTRPELVALRAPQALGADGTPVRGTVLVRFQPSRSHDEQLLSHWPLDPPHGDLASPHAPYPAASDEGTLYVSDTALGERTEVPRDAWSFSEDRTCVRGDFEAGRIYEIAYTTAHCPVAGCGLLATRDAATFFRNEGVAGTRPQRIYAYGVSQTGRLLRQFLYDGMNAGEDGRPAFDGILPHVAGARRGEFNHRYAQPSSQHAFGYGHIPPFDTGALIERAGAPVKVVETNSSSEYWRSDASLTHTDHADVRQYMFAGTMHGSGAPGINDRWVYPGVRTANPLTTVNYTPLLRALLFALDAWASEGVEPPPSAVPSPGVPREQVLKRFTGVPGATVLDPAQLPVLPHVDLGPDAEAGVGRFPPVLEGAIECLVSDVDDGLNETEGIRLPDVAVAIASHTGWNPRHASMGSPGQGVDMLGSTLPFPVKPEDADPRPAITVRYASRDDYLAQVRAHAEGLAAQRYLLDEDVGVVTRLCGRLWDVIVGA